LALGSAVRVEVEAAFGESPLPAAEALSGDDSSVGAEGDVVSGAPGAGA